MTSTGKQQQVWELLSSGRRALGAGDSSGATRNLCRAMCEMDLRTDRHLYQVAVAALVEDALQNGRSRRAVMLERLGNAFRERDLAAMLEKLEIAARALLAEPPE